MKKLLAGAVVFASVGFVALSAGCSTAPRRASGFGTATEDAGGGDAGSGFGTIPGKTGTDEACQSSATKIEFIPTVIEFVLDDSGSMTKERWDSFGAAFEELVTSMESKVDPALYVGGLLFNGSTKADPAIVDATQADDLRQLIDKRGSGGTPTLEAMTSGYRVLTRFKSPVGDPALAKRVLVVMSDGQPNSGETQIVSMAEENFQETPPVGPILTFSIGVGKFGDSSYSPKFMGDIAVAGGTAPANCDVESTDETTTCHFQVTPGDDTSVMTAALSAAFAKIRAQTATCEFPFALEKGSDPSRVNVLLTDDQGQVTKVKQNPNDGWSYDNPTNPTRVILNGASCEKVKSQTNGKVELQFGCATAK